VTRPWILAACLYSFISRARRPRAVRKASLHKSEVSAVVFGFQPRHRDAGSRRAFAGVPVRRREGHESTTHGSGLTSMLAVTAVGCLLALRPRAGDAAPDEGHGRLRQPAAGRGAEDLGARAGVRFTFAEKSFESRTRDVPGPEPRRSAAWPCASCGRAGSNWRGRRIIRGRDRLDAHDEFKPKREESFESRRSPPSPAPRMP